MLRSLLLLICSFFVTSPSLVRAQETLPPPAPVEVEEKSTREVAPGVELTTIKRNTPGAPLQMFVVKVNRSGEYVKKYQLKLATADYSVLKRVPVSQMAKQRNSVVAINGGYFAFGGAALGAVKVDGEWIRLPIKNRTMVGITEQGGVLLGNYPLPITLTMPSGNVRIIKSSIGIVTIPIPSQSNGIVTTALEVGIGNLNGAPPVDGFSVLTRRYGQTYKLREKEIALEIVDDEVSKIVNEGYAGISDKGWTFIVNGEASAMYTVELIGQKAELQIFVNDEWEKYSSILGAGPRLLKNGEIFTTEKEEEFRPDVIARGPRTAFGADKNGNWIFFVADGRAPEYSMGLTIPELALEMKNAGAVDALCMDGGGSSTLVINGEVINRPSDGKERNVPNALVVVPALLNE